MLTSKALAISLMEPFKGFPFKLNVYKFLLPLNPFPIKDPAFSSSEQKDISSSSSILLQFKNFDTILNSLMS